MNQPLPVQLLRLAERQPLPVSVPSSLRLVVIHGAPKDWAMIPPPPGKQVRVAPLI